MLLTINIFILFLAVLAQPVTDDDQDEYVLDAGKHFQNSYDVIFFGFSYSLSQT